MKTKKAAPLYRYCLHSYRVSGLVQQPLDLSNNYWTRHGTEDCLVRKCGKGYAAMEELITIKHDLDPDG
jgi:hypothetical protein